MTIITLKGILTTPSTVVVLAAIAVLSTGEASAQRTPGDVALGGELGDPSGVTLLFYRPEPSWEFLAAWDLDDAFFINGHALYERPLGRRQELHLFYGPGAFVGFRDRGRDDDEVILGISGTVGVGYMIDRFEIYGRITPRLSVVPETEGDFGAGIGFRFYF